MNTDCSICLEVLDGVHNRLTTDCGHCFHTNCFLQNVSHNGFACPNCRNQLVEEPNDEDDDEDDYDEDDYDDDEESDDDTSVSVAGPGLESHLLRGFRWLFQRVDDDDDDDDDEDDDDDDEFDIMQFQRGHGRFNEDHYEPISLQVIGEQMGQRGITFDDLVALIAFPHKDNAEDCAEYALPKIKELQTKIQEILEGTYQAEESTETMEDAAVLTAEDAAVLTAEDDALLTAESAFINFTNITANEPSGFGFDEFMTIFNAHNRSNHSTPAGFKVSELRTRIRKILEEEEEEEDSSDDEEEEEEEEEDSSDDEEEEVAFAGTTIIDLTADDTKDLTNYDILPSFQFFDLTDDE